jgi:hypothetical protein
MPNAADLQKASDEAVAIAKATKGGQSIICRAYVDPTSYCEFKVREDVFLHFDIDAVPDSLAESDVIYVPRKKTVNTTGGTKQETVKKTGAGSIAASDSKLIGRRIKIPCGTGLQRKVKGTLKDIKFISIRVSANMSLSAIILWINMCFKQASKKPTYFLTEAGARVTLNANFSDKTKLPQKKNA